MIDQGLEALQDHSCPYCGHRQFYRGPAAGLAVNIECKRCGERYQIAISGDDLLLAQRIRYNGTWPDRGDW